MAVAMKGGLEVWIDLLSHFVSRGDAEAESSHSSVDQVGHQMPVFYQTRILHLGHLDLAGWSGNGSLIQIDLPYELRIVAATDKRVMALARRGAQLLLWRGPQSSSTCHFWICL
jgi:hypothetical protein